MGVSTSLPFSSVQVAAVPFFNPSCSRNSAGTTTCPLELTVVRYDIKVILPQGKTPRVVMLLICLGKKNAYRDTSVSLK